MNDLAMNDRLTVNERCISVCGGLRFSDGETDREYDPLC